MKKLLFNKKILTLTSGIILSTLLASCGNRMDFSSNPVLIQDLSTPSTTGTDVNDLLKNANASYTALKDFTGDVTILDSKTGDPQNTDIGQTKFFFKKLRKERVEITKSSDPQKQGSIIVYLGTDKLQILLAKAIPLLGKKFTLAVNDKRVSTSRGVPFDQLDMIAMLNRLNKPGVKTTFLGEGMVNGRKSLAVEGIGSFKDIDNGVTREVVQIDAETMLPVQDEAFVDTKTVLKINVDNLKLNVGLSDDTFTLPNSILTTSTR